MKKVISTANAPAAIGPYSQAIVVGGLLFVNPTLMTDVLGLALIAAEIAVDKLILSKAAPVAAV